MQRAYNTACNAICAGRGGQFSLEGGDGESANARRVPAEKRSSRHLLCVELKNLFLEVHNSEFSIVSVS
jgi:hypothetical protein